MPPPSVIKKIGIEIEAGFIPCKRCAYGEYNDKRRTYSVECRHVIPEVAISKLACGWDIGTDGSLDADLKGAPTSLREVRTSPPTNSVKKLISDMKLIWPYINDFNNSMSMHAHISFGGTKKGLKVVKNIGTWEYVDHFQKEIGKRFPEVLNRIKKISYARFLNTERGFLQSGKYSSVNVFDSISEHGSIEFRAFCLAPEISRAIEYITFLDNDTASFIKDVLNGKIKPKCVIRADLLRRYLEINGYRGDIYSVVNENDDDDNDDDYEHDW